ncbi:MAG: hypothetical protein WBF53_16225, partial [Litorimonas sp.]
MPGSGLIRFLPLAALLVALALASQLDPAASTIELLYLRPIDDRTKALILATASCGPVVGWTLSQNVLRELGRGASRRKRLWFAFALAGMMTGATLAVAGFGGRIQATLSLMSGLQAATALMLVDLLARDRSAAAVALLVCASVATVSL